MISKNQQKLIRALGQNKQREKHRMFVIEGSTIIDDLLTRKELKADNLFMLTGTEEWITRNATLCSAAGVKPAAADKDELKKVTSLVTPPEVLAVVKMPETNNVTPQKEAGHILVFDAIRDPGNLGTIIRTADWFGFSKLVCSNDSVDVYNNKVIQSSMGAIIRLQPFYTDVPTFIEQANRKKIIVYGTTMDGADLYEMPIRQDGVIVFGNESSGIRHELEGLIRQKIRIPDYPPGRSGTESLNLASSVAVVCAELRRRR